MEHETLAQRLKSALSLRGLTQMHLAQKVGVTQGAIQKLTSGKATSTRKILAIAEALDVSVAWLERGVGTPDSGIANTLLTSAQQDKIFRVDALDIESLSEGGMFSAEFKQTVNAIEYTPKQAQMLFNNRTPDAIKVISVYGDSMADTIEPGEQIFVDITSQHFDGDGIYLFVFGHCLHVKRLQMQGYKMAVLSDNSHYEAWYIDKEEISLLRIVAKVLFCQSQKLKLFA
ncbi:helix-turn-helix transcriptional regulator [Xenorhabdus sp. XENO-10]|uniref:Helix-turn-helix transcriptional regulator n=1 Tax=Xenorhabdus yunnanensis TaxID=3025878 RepID=A0ABT5LLK7_9GAMM|nr:helix-turn-helix transcriptional regulator [Xenorhabdus yunnanensis]MDC9591423.1 helix-turn-helix transcriptional regulator [Xenorhabdus yunnanensis]